MADGTEGGAAARRARRALPTAAVTAALVVLAVACRRIASGAANGFTTALANYLRTFLYLGLAAAWGVSVHRRVVQRLARSALVTVSVLMALWLVLREFRWHLVLNADALRVLWYAYYPFVLLIPLLALFVSLSLRQPETYRLPKRVLCLLLPTLCLILLVLTNDLHQLVFRFPAGAVRTEASYRYGPGYYAVTAWGLLCAAAAFGVMLTKCSLPRAGGGLWLPLIPFGAAVLYVVLYALRVPFVYNVLGDLTATECLLFGAFFESCIQCGLIQSNTRYSDLFRASADISVQITDEAYAVRYAASAAEPIPGEDMRRAEAGPVILPSGRRLHNMPIRGGHAVWTEDIRELLAVRRSLSETQEELKEQNELLRMGYAQEAEYRRVVEQNRLYDLLQAQTRAQLDEVHRLTAVYETAEPETEKRRILVRIVVLGSYIKRRKDLALSMEGTADIPVSRLRSALEESFRAMALGGIRGVCFVDAGREALSGAVLTRAYDLFEDVTELVLDKARYVAVTVARVDGTLRCRVVTDAAAGGAALSRRYPGLLAEPDGDGGAAYTLPLEGGEGI